MYESNATWQGNNSEQHFLLQYAADKDFDSIRWLTSELGAQQGGFAADNQSHAQAREANDRRMQKAGHSSADAGEH
ncbi:hypothetical protein BC938DRAFT_472006 [Jimgerdemannia flammicorona]|uniref:Uncharacterized protein n=1 Tax=Jimgerdemannia flammicorona TaxID=994334 RepID=A0A433QUE2_9FUNG|nr:hypothetical protein BC938DRAFT_472006 [Jimgerdemannia flammicorona]